MQLHLLLALGLGLLPTAGSCSVQPPATQPVKREPLASAPRTPAAPAPTNVQVTPPAVAPVSNTALIEDERNTIEVFRATAPATVFVTQTEIVANWAMQPTEIPAGAGSGFIWDQQGHIVTNYHVVAGSGRRARLKVSLHNQKTYLAKVVGVEPLKDIAVLKIDAPRAELVPVNLPPAGYELVVGQKAVAIGNPFGLDHTLTIGVVSALGREVKGIGRVTIRDMIQTDAAINPGNSGGPLLDSRAQLIGMNTMIFSSSGSSAGVGFAVPVKTIARVVPQIIKTGHAEQVGIGVITLDDGIARQNGVRGVIIRGVVPGSPAARAGLRGLRQTPDGLLLGDVIVSVDKYEVEDFDDLYNALDRFRPGDIVKVVVLREGRKHETNVEVTVVNGE